MRRSVQLQGSRGPSEPSSRGGFGAAVETLDAVTRREASRAATGREKLTRYGDQKALE
jgi:hypothetical protein